MKFEFCELRCTNNPVLCFVHLLTRAVRTCFVRSKLPPEDKLPPDTDYPLNAQYILHIDGYIRSRDTLCIKLDLC